MEPELLRRDVHPAEVSFADGRVLREVRAFVTSHRLLVYEAHKQEITCVVDEPLAEPFSIQATRASLRGALDVPLANGRTAWVNKGYGCGCGSALKYLGDPVPWR